jgi:hypothetical protein
VKKNVIVFGLMMLGNLCFMIAYLLGMFWEEQ